MQDTQGDGGPKIFGDFGAEDRLSTSQELPGVHVQCGGFLIGPPAQNFSNQISVPTLVVIVSRLLLSIPAYPSIQVVIRF